MLTWTLQQAPGCLAVRTAGPAGGTPVVLWHGFFQDGRVWASLLERLDHAEIAEIRWIAADLPGHGQSAALRLAPLGDPAWPRLVCLLDRSLESLIACPPVIAGYSFGARAAAHWIGHSPLLRQVGLQGALLESAHPGLPPADRPPRLHQDLARAQQLLARGVAEFADDWSQLPLFASQQQVPAAWLAAQRAVRLQQQAAGLADHLAALGTGTMPLLDALPAPACRTTLLVGELDQAYAQLGQRWQRAWPAAALVAIQGAGHNVHLERPEAWWRQLLQLLADQQGRKRLD